ncbi:MAG TPA: pyridoxine 5'-phosphate synthase [Bacteroidia bacterium]|nr:pyridoxine 5'-phosphate synthase [Bacteroidia bacterium]HQF27322.1 pyridoxine 5'-phosphate synthase [Bacteroidia bacterium]HQK97180.1 pyridoxine 5'-phosphate synthase [Bacteroidia bacterium]
MTKLSVNINKIATIRNARGGMIPNVVEAALNIEKYGAHGITVHPRPDGRHIRYSDVIDLSKVLTTEFNIEGYPQQDFLDLCLQVNPHQVTLVPDPPDVLTSNAGWDTIKNRDFLKEVVQTLKAKGMRVSLFVCADVEMIENAVATGCDRVELYTESYASEYAQNREKAIAPFVEAAKAANRVGLGLNAGHDLSLENLKYFAKNIPGLLEVSIGHALISDALYYGLESTVKKYLDQLN